TQRRDGRHHGSQSADHARPGCHVAQADAACREPKMSQPTANILNMDHVRIDPAVALKLPPAIALRRKVLPFAVTQGQVYVACIDINDTSSVQVVEKFVSAPVRLEAAEPESLTRALDRVYGDLPGGDARGKPRSVDIRSAGELTTTDAVA